MESTFGRIKQLVRENKVNIWLAAIIMLISLFSFAMGYIFAKQQDKESIKIENGVKQEKNSDIKPNNNDL